MPLPATEEKYTYTDYLTWPDSERWELINGIAYNMTPTPLREHQDISLELEDRIREFFRGKKCKMYHAPFDVRFLEPSQKGKKEYKDDDIISVVQPDILVVFDQKKLDKRGCIGAPDLIIEIHSPSTVQKDKIDKFDLYEQHGVKEYWLVHPDDRTVTLFKLEKNKKYGRPLIFTDKDTISSTIFKELSIDLKAVFQ
ncbi:MAG: Uma2 family endonuclease [bacterium]|nr:Uma2 family endonuclease [bacterium]